MVEQNTTMTTNNTYEEYTVYVPEIHLVLGEKFGQSMLENQQKYSGWPVDGDELQQQLQEVMRIPLLVRLSKKHKGKKELCLYTHSYCLRLSPSQRGDAYTVFAMSRPTLKDHDELARGAVKLEVTSWHVWLNYSLMNENYYPVPDSNGFQEILDSWEQVEKHKQEMRAQQQEVVVSPLDAEQEKYLDIVQRLVTISQESEKEKEPAPLEFFYDEPPEATDVSRQKRDDVYKFHLSYGKGELKTDLFVRLKDNPRIRGKIIRVEGDHFTIRFGREIDIEELDPPGPFETVSIQTAFRVQHEAIESLRAGTINNPYLLKVLVDNIYQDYEPKTDLQPEQLNIQQLEAFQNARAVKDVLLVQGPPGTGKTHTITQLVQSYRNQGQRMLVTARTHKAVDNVLEHLQGYGLMVLRVGHEDKISYESKNLLIESQATDLQNYIIKNIAPRVARLEKLHHDKQPLQHAIEHIPDYIERLRTCENNKQQVIDEHWFNLDEARQTYDAQIKQLVTEERAVLQRRSQIRERLSDMNDIQLTAIGLQRKSALERQLEQEKERSRQIQERKELVKHEYQATCAMFQSLRQGAKKYSNEPKQTIGAIYRQIAPILEAARELNMPPPAPATLTPATFIQYLKDFQQKWSQEREMLEKRYRLLDQWYKQVKESANELHPVLIRRADVVGATCIGSASSHLLADVDFDLVLVDEAGQINVLDLLVPLIKAKRAILVGDHQQLPPLVDNDVYTRVLSINTEQDIADAMPQVFEGEDDVSGEDESISIDVQLQERMSEMLKKSVFELLFESASEAPGHMVTLTEQHRMPHVVADFVSRQFYNGRLTTAPRQKTQEVAQDELFPQNPLVFIDTADLPAQEKQEYVNGSIVEQENLVQGASYTNPKEADIIIRILEVFLKEGQEWVVIVPYRAQAEYLRTELRQRLQSEYNPEFDEAIATVDSFQGGERTKVIYGFTRSNPYHRVGFLSERRRLNVALTRTKQQLILVGDSATLAGARNASFRQLARALMHHVKKQGLYLSYERFEKRLAWRKERYGSEERTEA